MTCSSHSRLQVLKGSRRKLAMPLQALAQSRHTAASMKNRDDNSQNQAYNPHCPSKIPSSAPYQTKPYLWYFLFLQDNLYSLIPTVAWVFILTNLVSIITFWILWGIASSSSWYWNLTIEHNLNFSSLATPFVLINTPRDKGHLKKCRTPSTMHSWTGIQSS